MNSLEHALQLLTEANGSITSERISPSQSGSSKRKSRPVKRIINENEEFNVTAGELECAGMDVPEPLLASIQQQITSYASEEDGHRDEDEGASSEVLSTGSVEDTMEQTTIANADLLRKVAEVLSAGQQQQQNQQNQQQQQQRQYQQQFQNHSHSQTQGMTVFDHYLLAAKSLANGNGLLAPQISPLIGNTNSVSENYTSPECLLQAMLTPNLNFGLGHNPLVTNPPTNGLLQTPVVSPNSNFFQTFMNTQSVLAASRKPENRPPVVSQTLKATKRRLFTDDERARAEAANLNSDERIDMSDLEAFAQTFKKQRIKFGFTQGDVGVALGKRYGTDFSQTTISRFEALNLSFKNMCKLRPLLKEWLADIETAIEGGATITDLIERRTSSTNFNGSGVHMPELHISTSEASNSPTPVQTLLMNRDQHVKRRRKRTNLDLNQRASLDAYFAMNPRPDHDRMTEIANTLELDRDVVRVWFCNRRQKMRRVDEPTEGEVATPSVSPLFASFQHMNALEQLQAVKMVSSQHLNNDDSDGTSGSPDAPSVSLDGSNDV